MHLGGLPAADARSSRGVALRRPETGRYGLVLGVRAGHTQQRR
jgi:hypothetical protein